MEMSWDKAGKVKKKVLKLSLCFGVYRAGQEDARQEIN